MYGQLIATVMQNVQPITPREPDVNMHYITYLSSLIITHQ